MTERLHISLLDNALDYLLSAAEHAAVDERRSLKYAVLHLAAGIELVVKARLEREHWSLLFADVDKASTASLETGDFRSVDLDTAWRRLVNIGSVGLEPDDLKRLVRLQSLRNRIQHFEVNVEAEQARSMLADALNFVLEFLAEELPDELRRRQHVLDELHRHLREFENFVDARMKLIKDHLDAAGLLTCSRCWQNTLLIGDGDPHCPFCSYSTTAEELCEELGEGKLDEACPDCDEMTISFVLSNNEDGFDICTSCGYSKQTVGGDIGDGETLET